MKLAARIGLAARRRVTVAAVAFLTATALMGCSGTTSGGGPPRPPVSSTVTSTAVAGPAASSAAAEAPPRYDSPERLSAAVVGAVRAAGSVLITTTAEGTALVSRRSVQLRGSEQNSASVVTLPGRPDESLVVVDQTPYISIPPDPQGRHWLRLGYPQLADSTTWSSAAYAVDLVSELSAWRLAAAIRGGEVASRAGELVRTYVLTMGPAAAAAQMRLDRVADTERAAVEERLSRLTFELTVTLGPDNLPRTVLSIAPASGLLTTQTYSDWGHVSVSAPAPSDVTSSTA